MENTSATAPRARAGFSAWLNSEAGSALASYEKEKLDRILPDLFGYNIAQIGEYDCGMLASAKRIRNKIELRLDAGSPRHNGCALAAEAALLPFAARSIDVVVMLHVLEYVSDPDAVLREIERVLIEDGRLIIAGFSPWSLWRLNPTARNRPPWDGCFYSARKLKGWLSMLGFATLQVERFFFRSPRRHRGFFRRVLFLEKLLSSCWSLPGVAYVMIAQKRRVPVDPIKLNWRERILLPDANPGAATMSGGDIV